MKASVCELPNDWTENPAVIQALKDHVRENKTRLLLLPEMPFSRWVSGSSTPDAQTWRSAVASHDQWISRLEMFDVPIIAGTRPVVEDGVCKNTGFVWTRETGVQQVHEKYYLPDEEGFWEASWYAMGNGRFDVFETSGIKIGFLICTELWFTHHARDYARAGIHLLLCPRATPAGSSETWLAGGRAGAWISGAFCLSSNFNGPNTNEMDFGGTAWITEPDGGTVLGKTSGTSLFLTRDIDLQAAEDAKKTYPRYVKES